MVFENTADTNFNFNTTMAHKINPETCVACGACQGECPTGAITEGDVYSIDPDICIDCGACADACPTGSITGE